MALLARHLLQFIEQLLDFDGYKAGNPGRGSRDRRSIGGVGRRTARSWWWWWRRRRRLEALGLCISVWLIGSLQVRKTYWKEAASVAGEEVSLPIMRQALVLS